MWQYQKKLQIPVNIKRPNPKLANYIISQYGGPDGEMAASMRYLSQRFSMKDDVAKALLTDIGTEEMAHLEIVGTLVHQLTKNATTTEIENSPLALYYVDHAKGVWPTSAAGQAFTSMSFQVKGDPIADLVEDLAAEQKARVTYDNILRLSNDPDVNRVIAYLREREIVHFQRFGEALDKLQDDLQRKNKFFMGMKK
ncbi:MAG: manganese catalase family protein [Ruminococcaceae bacterium]|nr:manganese catalase family protein [Oscillospiraceae bacterium]